MKYILVLFILTAQNLMAGSPADVHNPVTWQQNAEKPEGIILDLIVIGRHLATWDVLPGSGNYNIGIVNLDTNQTHAVMTSPTNSAIINGLVTGNTYQFTIVKNGYIIIDIIDI
jgi:hypothetical protein